MAAILSRTKYVNALFNTKWNSHGRCGNRECDKARQMHDAVIGSHH